MSTTFPESEESDELGDWLALSLVPGLGQRRTEALIAALGSPAAVRRASIDLLQSVATIGPKLARTFYDALRTADVAAERDRMAKHGVRAVLRGTPEYPALLDVIPDPPYLLYARGTLSPADANAVAVIGSRHCTAYGRRVTYKLAGDLARAGYCVISGLARGIDGEAHRGALAAGGRTIAVLAGGLAKIYPPEHKQLADEVAASGCLVSEASMTMEPQAGMFHARNRLISGLARAVVVVEANERSGTLITVGHALEQGREAFAVPGNVDCPASAGTLQLIRNGAKPIRHIDDLLEDLEGIAPLLEPPAGAAPAPRRRGEPSAPAVPSGPPAGMDPTQQRVWELLEERRHADVLMREAGLPLPDLTRVLMTMELKKWVRRLPGNNYERTF